MIVQALWIGPLGTMERMCINSYLRYGHEFHLYSYNVSEPVVPVGTLVRDAAEILPPEAISLLPSPSIFSDYFRYALLAQRGGWYVDMDTLCLRPFTFDADYVFAQDNIDHYYISGCFMRAPAASPIMSEAFAHVRDMTADTRAHLGHMDIGPYLLQSLVAKYHLESYAQWPIVFDPIPWDRITSIVDPSTTFDLSQSWAIHLRRSIWDLGANHSAGTLPDGSKLMIDGDYPPECLWSRLKRDLL